MHYLRLTHSVEWIFRRKEVSPTLLGQRGDDFRKEPLASWDARQRRSPDGRESARGGGGRGGL